MKDTKSDRAALKFSGEIPEGEYNRTVDVEATCDGLKIDDYLTIPWDWVSRAISQFQDVGATTPDALLPSDALDEHDSSVS
jgi:hypothetical protein